MRGVVENQFLVEKFQLVEVFLIGKKRKETIVHIIAGEKKQ